MHLNNQYWWTEDSFPDACEHHVMEYEIMQTMSILKKLTINCNDLQGNYSLMKKNYMAHTSMHVFT